MNYVRISLTLGTFKELISSLRGTKKILQKYLPILKRERTLCCGAMICLKKQSNTASSTSGKPWQIIHSSEDDDELIGVRRKRKMSKRSGNKEVGKRSRGEEKGEQVQATIAALSTKYGEKSYTQMQYRIWAEMNLVGVHSSLDDPPMTTMFKGQTTLNLNSNCFSNWIAQCEFNVNPMNIDHVHTALCGTEFTHARWLQVATPPHSYHSALIRSLLQPAIIASRVEQIRGTQWVCSPEKHVHSVFDTQVCMPHLFGPHAQHAIEWSRSIRIKTTSGSGLGLIWIRSGLGKCAFSVDTLKPGLIWFNANWASSVDRP